MAMTMDIEYQPLNLSSRQVRLITLLPASDTLGDKVFVILRTVSLDDEPTYEALSYVWGDEKDTREISVDGKTANVTKNLEAALRRLRGPSPRVLWVDALCINQKDTNEKNHQVPFMSQLYTKCQHTIICLGEEGNNRIEAFFQWINSTPSQKSTDDGTSSTATQSRRQGSETVYLGYIELFKLSYWQRMWTYQEMVLPINDPICVYGDYRCPLSTLFECEMHLSRIESAIPVLSGLESLMSYQVSRTIARGVQMAREGGKETYLWSHLLYTAGRASSDPRDRIYALHGLCSGLRKVYPAEYNPRYHSPYRALLEATVYSIMYEAAFVATLGLFRMRPNRFLETALPSWVPDYNVRLRRAPSIFRCAERLQRRSIDDPMPSTRERDTAVIIGVPGVGVRNPLEPMSTLVPADFLDWKVMDLVLSKGQEGCHTASYATGAELVLLPGVKEHLEEATDVSREVSAGHIFYQPESFMHVLLGDKPTLRIAGRYIGTCERLDTFGEDRRANTSMLYGMFGAWRSMDYSTSLNALFLTIRRAYWVMELEDVPTLQDFRTGFEMAFPLGPSGEFSIDDMIEKLLHRAAQVETFSTETDEQRLIDLFHNFIDETGPRTADETVFGVEGIPELVGVGFEALQTGDIIVAPIDQHRQQSGPLVLRKVETSDANAARDESQNQQAQRNKEGTVYYKLVGPAIIHALTEESELVACLAHRRVEDFFVQ
ncbi:hypothetical protein PFICI_13464 [Pestalotiopsis fici W106-1]|uniref:Heterokaryon incompatibility domain-containing protein n=1 Tax=Pestalotiopsis fici (strain W106-1 / CGMCC3.15140) TaxID=1229662 RepID=W3WM29_PESFW|nr:uncharacterized protein PFICI_13464 [Pestalotiopsis fici W106-1]ETS74980.1 hypothetical protein PFICI_13464 [Pestalotiopsis fici W106-1]